MVFNVMQHKNLDLAAFIIHTHKVSLPAAFTPLNIHQAMETTLYYEFAFSYQLLLTMQTELNKENWFKRRLQRLIFKPNMTFNALWDNTQTYIASTRLPPKQFHALIQNAEDKPINWRNSFGSLQTHSLTDMLDFIARQYTLNAKVDLVNALSAAPSVQPQALISTWRSPIDGKRAIFKVDTQQLCIPDAFNTAKDVEQKRLCVRLSP